VIVILRALLSADACYDRFGPARPERRTDRVAVSAVGALAQYSVGIGGSTMISMTIVRA